MEWRKLKEETGKAYQAFCVFVISHPASLREVAKLLESTFSTISRWARMHNWIFRKQAFFNHWEAKRLPDGDLPQNSVEKDCPTPAENLDSEDVSEAHSTPHSRHIKDALALQALALKKFQSIDPEMLSNSEMVRFLTAGIALERAARKECEPEKERKKRTLNHLKNLQEFCETE